MVKILESAYAKAYLKQVANNATQLEAEERTQLISLLEYFEELFCGTLGECYKDPVNIGIDPGYKPFNSKYYTVPIINKYTVRKELKRLVEIRVLTPVQQSQYGVPIFIIPNK